MVRRFAMTVLGNGLVSSEHYEDALSVQEAELAMRRRLGMSEAGILTAQNNIASTYRRLGRVEEALSMKRDVYSGRLELNGEEHQVTLIAANNYTTSLITLERFEEAKSVLRKTMPVARRVVGEGHETTLRMRYNYARALYVDTAATLDDLREAVTTLEEIEPIARRVLGGLHPTTTGIEDNLRYSRAVLRACEAPSSSSPSEGV